jgi:solute carrier family 25 carnitine/acylcarnitine transporter 20/29
MSEKVEKVESPIVTNLKSFGAGGFGGVCAVLTGHPFDLVKVRLQTGMYDSAVQCVKQTIAKDGLFGLYRGVSAPLVGVTPMFAVSFWGYDVGKNIVSSFTGKESQDFTVGEISTAGFISAIPTTLVAAPFERVKVVMQVQEGKGGNSMLGTVRQMYREGGIRSVFKGSAATLARDGPGSAIYFATYEILKEKLSTPGKDMSLFAICTAGGFAGVSMWLAVFPIDTIKSTQQSSSQAISISQTTKSIYAKGGIKAFFPGVGPALLRSFPANAATFLGVELAKEFFDKVI